MERKLALQTGLQLFELLLVLLLSAVCLAFPLLSVSEIRSRQQVNFEALKLRLAIEGVSLHCLQTKTKGKIVLRQNSYTLFSTKHPARTFNLKPPVKIETNPKDDRRIIFYSDAVHSPTRIRISDGKRTCDLFLSLRGRVRKKCL